MGVGVSISPGYAYERAPDQEHFLNRRKTKELFRRVFALGKGKNWKFLHSGLLPRFPRRQSRISLHAVGHADAQHLRLAEAVLSARRRLRQNLQGIDGDDRLGHLRHRQVREVRQLHGALRLRADRGAGRDQQSARARCGPRARRPHQGRWRRKFRSRTAPRSSCSRVTSTRCCTKSKRQSPWRAPMRRPCSLPARKQRQQPGRVRLFYRCQCCPRLQGAWPLLFP